MMRISSSIVPEDKTKLQEAGIGAGASLVGGLLSSAAAKEAQKRKAMQEALMAGGESQSQMGQGQQKAFQSMMSGLGSALIRR